VKGFFEIASIILGWWLKMINPTDNPEEYYKEDESEPYAWEERKRTRGTWKAFPESFAYLPPSSRFFDKIAKRE